MKIHGFRKRSPNCFNGSSRSSPDRIAYSSKKLSLQHASRKRDCPRNSRNNPHCGGSNMQLNALAMATAALLAFGSAPLHAQTWQMPPDNQRCPSKWGAADQRGSANMMKPESILRAAKLIKTGELFELAAVLSPDPKEAFLNANRVFNIYTKPALPVP